MNRLFWIVMAVIGLGLVLLMVNHSAGETFGLANDDFGQLIWMGTLAAVIGAFVLRSGRPLGVLARQFGGWIVIVLVLIAGYQYRYELQDFASRISAGLVPGSPLALGEADGRATVTLQKALNGHFEARILIDGAPIRVVVDTGASSTVLSDADARAAGIDPGGLRYTVAVSTANGVTNAAGARAGEISIGGIVRRDMPVLVAAPGALGQSLLGMNFISTLSGFDVRGERMILRD
ncbi:MAG: aspartic protease [Kaistia sp. SCN 65-12]|nr:MAG: aspartic protease [Kaistia sp. SCN 65-12]